MKRVFASTCLAIFCAAGLAAQTQADDQRRKSSDPAKAEEKTVTITGCLRSGDTPGSFVLANVKADEAGARTMPPSPPTPPTPPSTPPTDPPSTPPTPPRPPDPTTPAGTSGAMGSAEVRLISVPANVDLSKHVGHTVAITGSWAPPEKATRPTGTTGTAGAASTARSFTVKSMAHKSETCQ